MSLSSLSTLLPLKILFNILKLRIFAKSSCLFKNKAQNESPPKLSGPTTKYEKVSLPLKSEHPSYAPENVHRRGQIDQRNFESSNMTVCQ